MENADTTVLLGTHFPYRAFYPCQSKNYSGGYQPGSLGAHCAVDMAVIGDIKATLNAIQPRLRVKEDRTHLDAALKHYQTARSDLDALATAKQARN